MRGWCICSACLVLVTAGNPWNRQSSAQQVPSGKASISIVSPPDGTIVQPGAILHIDVSVASDKPIRVMTIISPLGMGEEMRESPPWSFTLTLPTDDRSVGGGAPLLGKHSIFADIAFVGQGHEADAEFGAGIFVDVERPDMPIKLRTQVFKAISLDAFGEEQRIMVSGIFSDGAHLELNESSCLSFSSSDDTVAKVDKDGVVTAVGPGNALITVTYRLGEQDVHVSIPANFSPPPMNVEPRSLDFGEQQVGTPSAPLQVTLTNTMSGPMKIYKPKIEGEFSETDDCDSFSPLREDGGTCTVNVVFRPKEKGLRLGKLEVVNSYTLGTAIQLSGTGR
jgi:hypothetical protein